MEPSKPEGTQCSQGSLCTRDRPLIATSCYYRNPKLQQLDVVERC
uniref:Uncharacterized protein n=1 Tax=Macrostomum lignano TaxID=282301 RepID=A0A1I8FG27_9PLAT